MGEKLKCWRDLENEHGEYALSVHSKKINQRMEIIGHIPDAFLAKVILRLMPKWKIFR